jgi:hypothetical protein
MNGADKRRFAKFIEAAELGGLDFLRSRDPALQACQRGEFQYLAGSDSFELAIRHDGKGERLPLKRLRHDELTFSSVCLRTRCGLAQAARSGYGLLGRGSCGATRAIPRAYERCAEYRLVS